MVRSRTLTWIDARVAIRTRRDTIANETKSPKWQEQAMDFATS